MPLVRALLQHFWAEGHTEGTAQPVNSSAGEAKPRRTSGGRAEVNDFWGSFSEA